MNSIFKLSLYLLYKSLYGWLILAACQFILAWSFLSRLELWLDRQSEFASVGLTDFVLTPLFQLGLILLCFVLPFLCALAFAHEKNQGTWLLISSAPIHKYKILLGKFFSLLVFCAIVLLLILLMCFALTTRTQIDYGQIFTSSLLFMACGATMIMLGLFISSFFKQALSASLTCLAIFLIIFNLHWLDSQQGIAFISWLSFNAHMQNAYQGILSSFDLVFFISCTVLFYVFTILKLEKQ